MSAGTATRSASLVFAALVAASAGAFLVTQRLKQAPRLVRTLTVTPAISPHIEFRRASIRIRLERADRVTVAIVDADGDPVRRLLSDRAFAPQDRIAMLWNGRDPRGRPVVDGQYRIRVNLRRQGRAVVLLDTIRVDGTPPRPIVRVRRPQGEEGPLVFPVRSGGPVRFQVLGTTLRTERLFLYRTDGPRREFMRRLQARVARDADGTWDGRVNGRPAPPGLYTVVAKDTDQVGNFGFSFPVGARRRGDPPGGPGVTVRPLAVQAPLAATPTGRRFSLVVDARGREWRWRLHRLGQTRTLARGRRRGRLLRLRAPRGPSGVYVVQLASGPHRSAALVPVRGPGRHPVAVVLPLVSWQGRNNVDDDGDGQVDSLARGSRARLARPLAGAGIPVGFGKAEEPLLRALDRPQQRYELLTDVTLGTPAGQRQLRGRRGVVLAGDPQWLTPAAGRALRDFVDRGGRVFSAGTESLRRTVQLQSGTLVRPSRLSPADVFGSTVAPVARRRVDLLAGEDRIGLFRGGDGLFSGFRAFEETVAPGPGATIVARAEEQGARAGAAVVVAIETGRGLVIRTGLPEWEARMSNPNVAALTRRAWALLSAR